MSAAWLDQIARSFTLRGATADVLPLLVACGLPLFVVPLAIMAGAALGAGRVRRGA